MQVTRLESTNATSSNYKSNSNSQPTFSAIKPDQKLTQNVKELASGKCNPDFLVQKFQEIVSKLSTETGDTNFSLSSKVETIHDGVGPFKQLLMTFTDQSGKTSTATIDQLHAVPKEDHGAIEAIIKKAINTIA